jgi:branched-chain amino acid transport system permease protein
VDPGQLIGILPQQVVFGLALGAVYALLAVGYTMVYGVLFMINFAHGDLLMVGSMAGWAVLTGLLTAVAGAPLAVLVLAMLIAGLVGGLFGVAIERIAYRPLYAGGSSRLGPLISALGVSMILENGALLIIGAIPKVYPTGQVVAGLPTLRLGDAVKITPEIIIIAIVAVISMAAVEWLVGGTKWGRAMRGLRENRMATRLMGVNINRTVALTFFVGSALAGIGGVLIAVYYTQTDFLLGWYAGLKAFAAAVLGGIGNIRGAVVGGLLLGVIEALGITVLSYTAQFGFGIGYKDVIAFLVLVGVLTLKPTGILGERGA